MELDNLVRGLIQKEMDARDPNSSLRDVGEALYALGLKSAAEPVLGAVQKIDELSKKIEAVGSALHQEARLLAWVQTFFSEQVRDPLGKVWTVRPSPSRFFITPYGQKGFDLAVTVRLEGHQPGTLFFSEDDWLEWKSVDPC